MIVGTRGGGRRRRGQVPASAAVIAVIGALLAMLLAACSDAVDRHLSTTPLGYQPNIVFVLTDDLSSNLVQYMPHVLAMEKAGTSFSNYTVSDSFCCPSRASILTGNFPHDTDVFNNSGPDGGFHVFHARGEEDHTFGTALQSVGYRTAFMGKYLNGYAPSAHIGSDGYQSPGEGNWVPPGWNDWDVAGWGYPEYNYSLNENHHVQNYGHRSKDYLTDVLSHDGQAFIAQSALAHKPFMLDVSTFSPHRPFQPAKQDTAKFPGLTAPRGPSYGRLPKNAPAWLAGRSPLTAHQSKLMDTYFRRRVQSVQSVDRMIGDLEAVLQKTGQADHTIFVFSSDNGLHLGEHDLLAGKLTAFDTDVEVPLVVTGPNIAAGRVDASVVQNVDLTPTFEQIAGATVPADVDGRSIVPLLADRRVPWRTTALVEHHGGDYHDPSNPDAQAIAAGNPPTYEAIRTAEYTYVHYDNGEREYYDRVVDPDEMDNIYATLSPARVAALNARVTALTNCHNGAECWSAAVPDATS